MAGISRGRIGVGAAVVLACLAVTNLVGGQECDQSTLSGDWSYPPDWCETIEGGVMEITGPDSVNPGSTWVGVIELPGADTACEVTSNSGCTLSCSINGPGSEVTVTPGPNACGSFTVTVTRPPDDDCVQHRFSRDERR